MSPHSTPPPLYSAPAPSSPHVRSPRLPLPRRRTRSKSFMDELLPLPSSTPSRLGDHTQSHPAGDLLPYPVLRRIASVGVLGIFLVVVVFLALTTGSGPGSGSAARGLRAVFGYGMQAELGQGWVAGTSEHGHGGEEDAGEEEDVTRIDFDKYIMLRTMDAERLPVDEPGRRVIFVGDVHGSFAPLQRLADKLSYDQTRDTLVHVGDLVAKGTQHNQVLDWMRARRIDGVRGNHDQPVVQWRAWMEWAGRAGWESWVDGLDEQNDDGDETGVVSLLTKQERMYPKEWEWKGEHWKIARNLSAANYKYLLSLPLVIHMPSLHTLTVHAGLLPSSPLRAASDPAQPLVAAASNLSAWSTASADALSSAEVDQLRADEELALLRDIPVNQAPWTLLNVRSVYTKGKHRGEVTKSGKKGTPWSEVWNGQMGRCTGPGALDGQEAEAEESQGHEQEDVQAEQDEEAEVDETALGRVVGRGRAGMARAKKAPKIPCAPVSVVYGHAAGRGLDIKPFSKGIDTGCVYGRSLTALVLGDTSGLQGEPVTLAGHDGLLVSVSCEKGGL